METMIPSSRYNKRLLAWGYDQWYGVEPIGKRGGLFLMWKKDVNLTILHSSEAVIWSIIQDSYLDQYWLLGCVYGPPNKAYRNNFWEGSAVAISRL